MTAIDTLREVAEVAGKNISFSELTNARNRLQQIRTLALDAIRDGAGTEDLQVFYNDVVKAFADAGIEFPGWIEHSDPADDTKLRRDTLTTWAAITLAIASNSNKAAELTQLRIDLARKQSVLAELVACQELRAKIVAHEDPFCIFEFESPEVNRAVRDEYNQRSYAAWPIARAELAQGQQESAAAHNTGDRQLPGLPQQPIDPVPGAPAADPYVSGALAEIAAERHRQIAVEGWTPAHDDEHDKGELAIAFAVLAVAMRETK